ncbi:MAG: MFS transporter [Pseudomonadota bacterium]
MTDVTADKTGASASPGAEGQSFGSFGYRTYVLLTLTVVYTFNFIDRILISVVGRPIIDEFGLSNFQFGILSGLGFALFYTLLGIPIATLSERVSRVRIIGVCVILWSVATVLCGFTVGFFTLLLARLAVGVGEAGCTPPANSLISDYYKPISRPTALGIYAIGITAGGVLAQVGGGWMLENFTWRQAFIYVGAPGVIIGLIVLLTIKEPPRGYSDPAGTTKPERASFSDAFAEVVSKRTFWMVVIASTFCAFAGYSLVGFQPLHIQYTHGYSAGETAIRFMALFGIAGSLGAFLGGWLTERANRFSATAACWVPGIALILCGPIYFFGFQVAGVTLMFIAMFAANLVQYTYLGAQYNISQAVVSLRVRATSVAIFLFVVNLIGYGLGPPTFGLIADGLTNSWINSSEFAGQITATCSLTDDSLGETLLAACLDAKAHGIRWACSYATLLFSVAGIFFVLTGRTFVADVASARAKGA